MDRVFFNCFQEKEWIVLDFAVEIGSRFNIVLHAFDTLFTAGPCILGAMVNKVLGRHGQTPFEPGEMDIWESSKKAALEKGTEFVIGFDDRPSSRIPGKTIILNQNKWDVSLCDLAASRIITDLLRGRCMNRRWYSRFFFICLML